MKHWKHRPYRFSFTSAINLSFETAQKRERDKKPETQIDATFYSKQLLWYTNENNPEQSKSKWEWGWKHAQIVNKHMHE